MIDKSHYPYIFWGAFAALLITHSLWCQFGAYPITFEKNLKKGKSWVYIPLQWKGFYKVQVQFFSRLLLIGVMAMGMFLIAYYTRKVEWFWLLAYGLATAALTVKLNSLWLAVRFQQQEDSYYYVHDELRAKLESEGKDMADSAFKNLAAYQHQNLLRKADEQGQLIRTLRSQSRKSRQLRRQARSKVAVDAA